MNTCKANNLDSIKDEKIFICETSGKAKREMTKVDIRTGKKEMNTHDIDIV